MSCLNELKHLFKARTKCIWIKTHEEVLVIEQIKKYNIKSNNIPKICLNFRTPNEVMQDYLNVM